jgi:hypothetical protein
MGRQPVVVLTDPELCREAGIKKFKSLVDRSAPAPIRSSPIHYKSLLFTKYNGVFTSLYPCLCERDMELINNVLSI